MGLVCVIFVVGFCPRTDRLESSSWSPGTGLPAQALGRLLGNQLYAAAPLLRSLHVIGTSAGSFAADACASGSQLRPCLKICERGCWHIVIERTTYHKYDIRDLELESSYWSFTSLRSAQPLAPSHSIHRVRFVSPSASIQVGTGRPLACRSPPHARRSLCGARRFGSWCGDSRSRVHIAVLRAAP
eukprot:scaffold9751_cov34-Tisochrysis_lutea.AAC.3